MQLLFGQHTRSLILGFGECDYGRAAAHHIDGVLVGEVADVHCRVARLAAQPMIHSHLIKEVMMNAWGQGCGGMVPPGLPAVSKTPLVPPQPDS